MQQQLPHGGSSPRLSRLRAYEDAAQHRNLSTTVQVMPLYCTPRLSAVHAHCAHTHTRRFERLLRL